MTRLRLTGPQRLLQLGCLIWCLTSALARGDGSVAFNGTSASAVGSSKLENSAVDVLAGASDMTVCAWVYATGQGEGQSGTVLALDEAGSDIVLRHYSSSSLALRSEFGTVPGFWSFPIVGNGWNAVTLTYNKSTTNPPVARVNFADVTETQVLPPSGNPPSVDAGYCIGNVSDGSATWQGRIAHVQVFNRQLSQDEQDACLRAPGSITKGLRLWLPMTNGIDIHDRSGNQMDAIGTDIGTGDDGPSLTESLGVPPRGAAVANSGYTNVNQFVIPRFGDGAHYPAGRLSGGGPTSVVRGTAATATLPSGTRAVVVTQDYDVTNMSQWQNGTFQQPGYAAAVLCPVIRDVTIAGYDPTGNNYADSGSDVNSEPWVQNIGSAPKYDLLRIRGNGAEVRNVKLFACPGTAMVIKRDINQLNGQVREFDREVNVTSNVCFNRVFAGIEIRDVDQQVAHIEGTRWRDFGVKSNAHNQLHDIHVYGGGGYGIWLASDGNQLTNSYSENVPIGLYVQGSQNVIKSLRAHHCATENVWLAGNSNLVDGFWIGDPTSNPAEVIPLGILVDGQENQICNGRIDMRPAATPNPATTGIKLMHPERHTITDVIFNAYGFTGTAAIDADFNGDPSWKKVNGCTIRIKLIGGGTGIDLNDAGTDRLGVGNTIEITTSSFSGTAIDLVSGWDDWKNKVTVDGALLTSAPVELTIASGGATVSRSNHVIDTEGDLPTDELTGLYGGITGRTVVLRAANTNRTVVVRDGVDNLRLEGDFSLDNTEDTISLLYDGTNWVEKARSNNGG